MGSYLCISERKNSCCFLCRVCGFVVCIRGGGSVVQAYIHARVTVGQSLGNAGKEAGQAVAVRVQAVVKIG